MDKIKKNILKIISNNTSKNKKEYITNKK